MQHTLEPSCRESRLQNTEYEDRSLLWQGTGRRPQDADENSQAMGLLVSSVSPMIRTETAALSSSFDANSYRKQFPCPVCDGHVRHVVPVARACGQATVF